MAKKKRIPKPKKKTTRIKPGPGKKTKTRPGTASKSVSIKEPSLTPPRKGSLSAREKNLHELLLKKKREITRDMEEHLGQHLNEDVRQRLADVLDSGDQATVDISAELDLSFLEIRNKTLKAIDESLDRLAEGSYGLCTECGTEIPEKRLSVVPFAATCVACQEKQETLEKIEKEEDRFK